MGTNLLDVASHLDAVTIDIDRNCALDYCCYIFIGY
jgi:hypothetical protein